MWESRERGRERESGGRGALSPRKETDFETDDLTYLLTSPTDILHVP